MSKSEAAGLHFTLEDLEDTAPAVDQLDGTVASEASEKVDAPPPGAVIKVVGVGGGGGNAINRMMAAGVEGVDFIAVNTDCQALAVSRAPVKIQIGRRLTRGLGSGARPEVGRESALEDTERLMEAMSGADMVFITTGLGGGTGTGASPVISSLAAELDALVVAVVTKPFSFEGRRRREQAEAGVAELRKSVDTVICIPNDKLLHTVDRNTSVPQAFNLADDVLRQAVQGISDLILTTGDINRDFADVRTVMKGMGMALMGTGIAEGENRAVEAAQQAVSSPLLEDASIQGARGVIFNVTGGEDLTLHEVNDAASIIHDAADPDATILFGYVTHPEMNGKVKVTVIATGFESAAAGQQVAAQQPTVNRTRMPVEMLEESEPRQGSTPSEVESPVVLPVQKGLDLENLPGLEDGAMANLNRADRHDFEIPAFLRRMQD
ncbi:MAG TPA: cell division protein FtsZ [Acidobacteria bacterium]|nr:cell division protein FtsZ [Acidobacteriota bacterium]